MEYQDQKEMLFAIFTRFVEALQCRNVASRNVLCGNVVSRNAVCESIVSRNAFMEYLIHMKRQK